MKFEFATAGRILVGPGTVAEAPALARSLGSRALVVTGRTASRSEKLCNSLRTAGMEVVVHGISGEPSVEAALAGADVARKQGCDLVVGFGGGSALDAAKAIAALATNPGDVFNYLEVIGRAAPLSHAPLPCIAIPSTAGTGAEVTRNAVLFSPTHKVKVSLRSPLMLPRAAIVDPDLTLDLPPDVTAATGMDALTQLIEPYVCNRTNPLTDGLCLEGMARVARSLRTACAAGRQPAAREDMAVAAMFSGMALANAGLGAVHGFAAPLGGMFQAPHGAVCAALLPPVMAANLKALRRASDGGGVNASTCAETLRRYDQVARTLTGNPAARADDGVEWVQALRTDLRIPPLRKYGFGASDVPALIEKAATASSMKANPVTLTAEEMRGVVEEAV
jgi:alcohol dehydrogenase class IV